MKSFTKLVALTILIWSTGVSSAENVVEIHMKTEKGHAVFSPDTVTISPGTTVRWVNDDPTKQSHTVTSGSTQSSSPKPDKIFDSKFLAFGKSFEFKFEKVGTFEYYCLPHFAMKMFGTVIVK